MRWKGRKKIKQQNRRLKQSKLFCPQGHSHKTFGTTVVVSSEYSQSNSLPAPTSAVHCTGFAKFGQLKLPGPDDAFGELTIRTAHASAQLSAEQSLNVGSLVKVPTVKG
jgi:hypothetical protein